MRLADRVLVCDGAMGTMLYSKGVFVNRCFDALNLSQPDLVAEVHQDYVRAGADVIETNTFGANRVKLARVRAGGQGARDQRGGGAASRGTPRASRRTWRARSARSASASSRGARPAWTRREEYFREQARGAARGRRRPVHPRDLPRSERDWRGDRRGPQRCCDLPIVAQMTTEDDGNTLDGTPPEKFAPELERRGAHIVGVNCSVGPAPMLETIERIGRTTDAPLSAQPNAGKPRDIEGRTHLPLVARVHGVLRPAVHREGRAAGRRLLRHDARAHPPDQAGRGARRPPRRPRVTWPRGLGAAPRRRTGACRRCRASRSRGSRTRWRAGRSCAWWSCCRRAGHEAADDDRGRPGAEDPRRRRRQHPRRPAVGARMSALSLAVLIEQQAGIETRPALRLPRPEPARHAVGSARRARDGRPQPAARHRRPAARRRLSRRHGRVRRRLDRAHQRREPPEPRRSTSAASRSAGRPRYHIGVAVNPTALESRRGDAAVRVQGRGRRGVRDHAAGVRPRGLRGVPAAHRAASACPSSPALWPFESQRTPSSWRTRCRACRVPEAVARADAARRSAEAARGRGRRDCREMRRGADGPRAGIPAVATPPGGRTGSRGARGPRRRRAGC